MTEGHQHRVEPERRDAAEGHRVEPERRDAAEGRGRGPRHLHAVGSGQQHRVSCSVARWDTVEVLVKSVY